MNDTTSRWFKRSIGYCGLITMTVILPIACGDDDALVQPSVDGGPDGNSDSGTGVGAADARSDSAASQDSDFTDAGSGDACSDASAPLPVDPITACVRVNACEANGGTPIGLENCIDHALDAPWEYTFTGNGGINFATLKCKLAATDCAGVLACTPPVAPFDADCAANGGADFCKGDTWVVCDAEGKAYSAMNCKAAGLQCGTDVNGAGCGSERCEYLNATPSCDPNDPNVLIECSSAGNVERVDCRLHNDVVYVRDSSGAGRSYTVAGQTCGFNPVAAHDDCIGTGDACAGFSQRCDGNVLETCSGQKLTRRDCSTVAPEGQGCGFVTSGEFAGLASCGVVPGSVCDLGSNETCVDGVASFCNIGKPASVDCKAAGFQGCTTSQLGGRTIAYCTP